MKKCKSENSHVFSKRHKKTLLLSMAFLIPFFVDTIYIILYHHIESLANFHFLNNYWFILAALSGTPLIFLCQYHWRKLILLMPIYLAAMAFLVFYYTFFFIGYTYEIWP